MLKSSLALCLGWHENWHMEIHVRIQLQVRVRLCVRFQGSQSLACCVAN